MSFVWDTTSIVGLLFNIVIVIVSYAGYKNHGTKALLYIAIAFVIFAVSYILTLGGFRETLGDALTAIRAIAYLVFVYALYKLAVKQKQPERKPAAVVAS